MGFNKSSGGSNNYYYQSGSTVILSKTLSKTFKQTEYSGAYVSNTAAYAQNVFSFDKVDTSAGIVTVFMSQFPGDVNISLTTKGNDDSGITFGFLIREVTTSTPVKYFTHKYTTTESVTITESFKIESNKYYELDVIGLKSTTNLNSYSISKLEIKGEKNLLEGVI